METLEPMSVEKEWLNSTGQILNTIFSYYLQELEGILYKIKFYYIMKIFYKNKLVIIII